MQIIDEYSGYGPVLIKIQGLMEKGGPVVVAIDGRCGSGKTYLAGVIGNLFSCPVIHMDDFYLPPVQRPEGWQDIPGGNMDFERFRTEVLIPVRSGIQTVYRPYSCQNGCMGEPVQVPFCRMAVVEGSYSQHPVLAAEYDLKIFLTCSREEQRKRLQMREGPHFAAYKERWIPMEEKYFQCCAVENGSHLIVDTSSFF